MVIYTSPSTHGATLALTWNCFSAHMMNVSPIYVQLSTQTPELMLVKDVSAKPQKR